jgi:D-inositol-3-phosphate glycosyltransferase
MRIAMVSEHASPLAVLGGVDAGGQNVHVADLARALGRLGVEVVVHTRRDDPALPRRVPFAPGVVVDHVDAGPAAPVPKDQLLPHMDAFAADLRAAWSLDRPDVVHSHFWMSGLAALQAARPLSLPVAHTFHALGSVKRRHQGFADTSPAERLAIEADLARQVDLVVATTADEVVELTRMGGGLERVAVVPCGVDLGRFRPDGPREPRTRRPRIVAVSRLVERKGIGNLIAALTEVPDAELVVAGGPPAGMLDDDAEGRRFLALAETLGVADRVEMRGAVARDQVPALLRSADVVACCPWYEPFGLVAVEAMACGVPVVVSAVGGLAETVVDGVTGIHVPPRQPARIATALRTLLGDEALRRSMGAAGARRSLRYGWDRIATETLAHAGDLVGSSTRVGEGSRS